MMLNIRLVYINRKPYDYTDKRFVDLPPEIRVGIERDELKKIIDEQYWFKEIGDSKVC